jgi:5-amino-6-(5-phosphoribosylamino)uracil reductase
LQICQLGKIYVVINLLILKEMKQKLSTTVILAMTADGKIADEKRSPARFGSLADKLHLEKQIALVDAVLFGAATLRAYGTTLTITNPSLLQAREKRGQPFQPIHIVCSASGKLDPDLKFFEQPIRRWLLTTSQGAQLWQDKEKFERVLIAKEDRQMNKSIDKSSFIDWKSTFVLLEQLGITKLAILGGGELVASLLAANLIEELWLTICPLLFGGKNAPTPVEGHGFTQEQAQKLDLVSVEQIGQELFLHYRLHL